MRSRCHIPLTMDRAPHFSSLPATFLAVQTSYGEKILADQDGTPQVNISYPGQNWACAHHLWSIHQLQNIS